MRRHLSLGILLLGFICFLAVAYHIWQRVAPKPLIIPIVSAESLSLPQILQIPDLGVVLTIYPAEISKGKWQVTNDGISYLSSSPIPGKMGNSILYGHNWPSILGKLDKARIGEKFYVVFSDGTQKRFVIKRIAVVDPSDTSILTQTNDSRVTLYTCTGFLDRRRLVIQGTPS